MNEPDTNYHCDPNNTLTRTLWSATLIDILLDALEQQRSDKQIINTIKDLHRRQFNTRYIISKVRSKLGEQSGDRVVDLINRMRA